MDFPPRRIASRADLDAWLATFTNYERMPAFHQGRVRVDLSRMERYVEAMGHPQRGIPAVHVTGTKGKGSTAMFCARILSRFGATGLHTSPHLSRMEERIAIDGEAISEPSLIRAANEILEAWSDLGPAVTAPTFFEFMTLAAFSHFRAAGCAFQVHEVGMGGRLDATNVLRARACAITNVDLEHTAVLGRTTAEIAAEKSGILHPGAVLVTSEPEGTEARAVIEQAARREGVPVRSLGREVRIERLEQDDSGHLVVDVATTRRAYRELRPRVIGSHQAANLAVAVALAEELVPELDEKRVRAAVSGMVLPARLERIGDAPALFVDGAHTAASLCLALRELEKAVPGRSPVVVLGMARDKHVEAVAPVLRGARYVVTCAYGHPRALDPEELLSHLVRHGVRGEASTSPQIALARALDLAEDRGVVLVAGSLYLAAELRSRPARRD